MVCKWRGGGARDGNYIIFAKNIWLFQRENHFQVITWQPSHNKTEFLDTIYYRLVLFSNIPAILLNIIWYKTTINLEVEAIYNTTDATIESGIAYPSGSSQYIWGILGSCCSICSFLCSILETIVCLVVHLAIALFVIVST